MQALELCSGEGEALDVLVGSASVVSTESGRALPNVWHQRRAQRVRCIPGLADGAGLPPEPREDPEERFSNPVATDGSEGGDG